MYSLDPMKNELTFLRSLYGDEGHWYSLIFIIVRALNASFWNTYKNDLFYYLRGKQCGNGS